MNYVCYWDLTVYTKFTTSDHLKLIETHDFPLFSLYGIINSLIFGSVNNCFNEQMKVRKECFNKFSFVSFHFSQALDPPHLYYRVL